jgi:uncharacterized membrane protein YbhN (UPF0104 family)
MLLLLVVGVYLFLPQLGAFKDTFTILHHASSLWLVTALVASALTFLAGAITQFAAGDSTGRFVDITLLQFAGAFINHFLPFSLGGVNMTTQYYKKHGKTQSEAITMASIPIFFGIITTVLIVAIVSPITIVHLVAKLHGLHLSTLKISFAVMALIIVVGVVIFFRHRVVRYIQEAWVAIKEIANWRRLALLTVGSIGVTLFSSLALQSSILAVHGSVGIVSVLVIYVTSSLVSNVAPTPGGIGATEAVIVLELVAAHVHLPEAAASTVLFRLFTFWLPIVPGGIALRYIRKHKVL